MVGVYKITNPKGKTYIGSSWNISERFRQYKKYGARRQPKLNNSFLKYGVDNHTFEIIEECIKNLTYEIEYKYQVQYNSINDGLNCNYVNVDGNPIGHSEETKLKISKSLSGRKHPHKLSTKTKISEGHKKNRISKEDLLTICNKHLHIKEVTKELNISHTTLTRWLVDYKITENVKNFFKNIKYNLIKKDILKNYKNCKTRFELVEKCYYIESYQSLDRYLKELKLKKIVNTQLDKNKKCQNRY